MIYFWLAAIGLVILALVILYPMVRARKLAPDSAGVDQILLNKRIYKERLSELETELSQGEIDQDNFDSMVKELKSSLLDDVSGGDNPDSLNQRAPSTSSGTALTIAVVLLLIMPALWYWQFGAHKQVTHWQNVHAQLQQYIQRGVMQQGEPLSESEMVDFALALRTELQVNPTDDATVWLLLGRIGLAINDGELAMESMERAYRMAPANPSVALGYAQVASYSQDPNVVHRGARILDALIAHNPDNLDALSLKAFQAFERGDHQSAKATWQKMASLLDDSDPRKATIERTLAMLQAQQPQTDAEQNILDTATAAASQQASVGQKLAVIVDLAPELRSEIPPSSNLVVFARAKDGPPMPLAVKRMAVGNFPVRVVLSDGDAMMPEMKLSSFPQVYVTARVSKDQDVRLTAGELEGIGEALSLNGETQTTHVTINVKH